MHKRALEVGQTWNLRPCNLVSQYGGHICRLTFPIIQESCSIDEYMAPVLNALAVSDDINFV